MKAMVVTRSHRGYVSSQPLKDDNTETEKKYMFLFSFNSSCIINNGNDLDVLKYMLFNIIIFYFYF